MTLEGMSVCGGIAIGRLAVCRKGNTQVGQTEVSDTIAEKERFTRARDEVREQLEGLYEKALQKVDEADAEIFRALQLLLDDPEYGGSVTGLIENKRMNAEWAVASTGDAFARMLASTDAEYMREREADVRDITDRILAVLQGAEKHVFTGDEPVILLAEDLTPGETLQLDKGKVLSFVTSYGSPTSHTAILARAMKVPALTGVSFPEDADGKYGIVDGYAGRLILEPDEATLAAYRLRMEEDAREEALLMQLRTRETMSRDGRSISLYANIGSPADAEEALSNGAEGVGLFRSELLYLEAEDYPTEEAQFAVYRAVAELLADKRLVIRTLDVGADKQVGYLGLDREENPALGYRGIRVCLDRPDVFKTQLRAIFRASQYGNLAVMFPMIISVEDVRRCKEILAEVKRELAEEGIPYRDCEIGVMIETPAAVMISDLLAQEVDFFSVGTNDLTQYTLAIDRGNPKLYDSYDSHHEAVLRMLRMVVDNAHKAGIRVGICGELAADVTLTRTFLEMGFDELSVSPSMLLKVRKKVRE